MARLQCEGERRKRQHGGRGRAQVQQQCMHPSLGTRARARARQTVLGDYFDYCGYCNDCNHLQARGHVLGLLACRSGVQLLVVALTWQWQWQWWGNSGALAGWSGSAAAQLQVMRRRRRCSVAQRRGMQRGAAACDAVYTQQSAHMPPKQQNPRPSVQQCMGAALTLWLTCWLVGPHLVMVTRSSGVSSGVVRRSLTWRRR